MHTFFIALMANKNIFRARKDKSYTLTPVHTKIEFCNRWEAGSQFIQSIHDNTLLIACGIVLLLAHYMNIMKEVMSVRGGKFYCVFTRFEGFCIEWKQK